MDGGREDGTGERGDRRSQEEGKVAHGGRR